MIFLIKLLLYPFIIFYGALAIFAYRNVCRTLKVTRKFKENKDLEIDPEWEGFVRTDFNKWDEKSMKIGCFTRFPLKCMVLLFYTISITIVIVLTTKNKRLGKKIQLFFVKYIGNLALWSILGIKEECDPEKSSTPIIISNHVSWIDIVYLTKRIYPLAIVSKEAIKNAPIVGTIARDIQCLFILRESPDARKDIMEKIQ